MITIQDPYAKKKLKPFLEYLFQTPAAELLNDYTYLLVFIGREPDEQLERLQYLENQVTAPGTGIKWTQVDTWRAGCAKRAAQDPVAFYESADSWHDKHFGKQPAPDCIQNVQTQTVQWLVPGLLPLGEVSLLGADGGTGKGIWQAQLIAYVTTGKTSGFFPAPPPKTGNVLVLTGEDDPGKVLKSRYIAAGADVSKVFVLSSDEYYDKAGKILTLKDAALAEYAAKCDPALLIIDPLQSFLPEDVEMGSRNQMRSAIVPLRGISKRQNCAALISMHSNKKQGVSGRARLADSSDIWDLARSVLMMGRSKNDGKLYLSHEKASYSAPQQTVLLHIEDTAVHGIQTARAVFDGYTDKKDADFIAEKRFRLAQTKDDTAAAILNTLAECRLGSMANNDLRAAVLQEGHSQRTYERAYSELVKSGEIEKFQLNQKGGVRGWFTRIPLQGKAHGEVTK